MKFYYFCLIFLLILIYSNSGLAQSETAFIFLTIETDPIAQGMGGSGVAGNENLFGVYYNPAHLNDLNRWGAAYQKRFFSRKNEIINDNNYFLFSGGYRLNKKHILRLFWREIQYGYLKNNYYKYLPYERAIWISYGFRFNPSSSVGFTAKYLKHTLLSREGKTSWAIDVGYKIRNLFPNWTSSSSFLPSFSPSWILPYQPNLGLNFGAAFLNVGPRVTYVGIWSSTDPLPQTLRLGLSYYLFSSPEFEWSFHFDFEKLLVHREENNTDPFYKAWFTAWEKMPFKKSDYHFGTEMTFYSSFSARFGFRYAPYLYEKDQFFWTFGFGFKLKYLSIQYGQWIYREEASPYYENASLLGIYVGDF